MRTKENVLVIGGVIVGLVGLAFLYHFTTSWPSKVEREIVTATEDENAEKVSVDSLEQALKLARELGRNVYLEFSADWCYACRIQAKVLEDPTIKKILSRQVVFFPVDVDKNRKLAEQFGITAIPTNILLRPTKTGYKVLEKHVGAMDRSTLIEFLKGR